MKFALLGIDAESLSLVREIARSDAHQLGCFAFPAEPNPATLSSAPPLLAELRRLCPLAEELPDWEILLSAGLCDAVIVAGPHGTSGRFEQLRRLVQEAVPVVVTHPPAVTLLEAYELEMVRQESRGVVVPLLPWHWFDWSPWWPGLIQSGNMQQEAGSQVARVDQITWERSLADRSQKSVLAHLARDVDFIRLMCGEVTQVAALGAVPLGNGTQPDCSALSAQMTGPAGILVRWSVQTPDDEPGSRITVAGSAGKVRLDVVEQPDGLNWTTHFPAGQTPPAWQRDDISKSASLPDLVAKQVRLAAGPQDAEGSVPHPTWPDAVRSLELVEGVEKSLRKGRTISVGLEGRSETDAFKGTMASVGCALLMGGVFFMIGAELASRIADRAGLPMLRDIFRWWPAVLLAVFVPFALMQLLRFIIPRQPGRKE